MTTKLKVLTSILGPFISIIVFAVAVGLLTKENEKKAELLAQITDSIESKEVNREEALRRFFSKYNSPLIDNVETFVKVADKYGIDFRLLPAISCIESSCGKKLIPGSYNPFGWGIYGDNVIRFKDYNEAIETVGKGLNEGYFAKGLDTPEEIAPVYTPPAHQHWLGAVRKFMSEITVNYSDA